MIIGGNLSDYTLDSARRWPSKTGEKRSMHVSIESWVGSAPGASHYRVIVNEEKNAIWDEHDGAWRECWDELDKGDQFSATVTNRAEAERIAKTFVKWASHGEPGRDVWGGGCFPVEGITTTNGKYQRVLG